MKNNKIELAIAGTTYEERNKISPTGLFDDISDLYEVVSDMTAVYTGCYNNLEEMIEEEFSEAPKDAAKIIDRLKKYTVDDLTPDELTIYKELYEEQGSELDYCEDVFENYIQYNVVKAIIGAYIFGEEE